MDATTFLDPSVVSYINDNFYAVHFDAETKDTINFDNHRFVYLHNKKINELALSLLQGQAAYPTSVFLNEKAQIIAKQPGYLTATEFKPLLAYIASKAYQAKTFEQFVQDEEKSNSGKKTKGTK
jgi:thioredoxin-related protein